MLAAPLSALRALSHCGRKLTENGFVQGIEEFVELRLLFRREPTDVVSYPIGRLSIKGRQVRADDCHATIPLIKYSHLLPNHLETLLEYGVRGS